MAAVFGHDDTTIELVFEVFALMEMAWHDCYGEITPSETIVDDVLLCSGGTLDALIHAAHLAVMDQRDLSLRAAHIRSRDNSGVS